MIMNKNNEVVLCPYNKADIAAIRKIYSYYVKNSAVTFDIEMPSKKAIEEKYQNIAKQGHPIIIAKIDKKLVGFAYASSFRPRPAYRFTCENAIYVDRNMTGKGVGNLLMAELLKQAKNFGFKQMIAIITAGTNASIALHKKHGFEINGTLNDVGYKFDQWYSIILMQKRL